MSALEQDAAALQAVTEGLRAGPGTAEWEAALRVVGSAAAGDGADELALLMRVRRGLAAGKSWREVRAGEGFTRKLMGRLDAGTPAPGHAASWLAWGSAAIVLGLIIWAALVQWGARKPPPAAPDGTLAFARPRVAWDMAMKWPAETSIQGSLKLDVGIAGLRVAPEPTPASAPSTRRAAAVRRGGAAVLEAPVGDGAIEVALALPAGLIAGNVATQVFLTNDTRLDTLTAVGSGEWVLEVNRAGVRIVTPALDTSPAIPLPAKPDAMVVRILLVGDRASAEVNGRRAWDGALGLAVGRPRYVGVRFLVRGELGPAGTPAIRSVRVLGRG